MRKRADISMVFFPALLLTLCCLGPSAALGLSGGFVHFGYNANDDVVPEALVPKLLDEFVELDLDTVIILATRVTRPGIDCARDTGDFEWLAGFPGKLGTVLDAAHVRGMTVWVGGTLSGHRCHLERGAYWEPPNTDAVAADVYGAMAELAHSYRHHPAFAGWYVPDEPDRLESVKVQHFTRVVRAFKTLTPELPVAAAPYIGGRDMPSPREYAFTARLFLHTTGLDVLMMQDGTGAFGTAPLDYWSRNGYSTRDYFDALARRLPQDALWAVVEIFNNGDPLINRNPSRTLSGAYRGASALRINQQLRSTRAASKQVAWLPQWHFFDSLGPSNGYSEAPRIKATYRALKSLPDAGEYLVPPNFSDYYWDTPPSRSYPDATNATLFNRRPADPRNAADAGWVGVLGTAVVTVDLGVERTVDWVSAHLLTYTRWGIRAPQRMDVLCSTDGARFTLIDEVVSPFTSTHAATANFEEQTLGNTAPLGHRCRWLRIRLPNSTWTFISELELVGPRGPDRATNYVPQGAPSLRSEAVRRLPVEVPATRLLNSPRPLDALR